MRKIIGSALISLTLVGCASHGPTAEYVYKPKTLTSEVKKELQALEKRDDAVTFDESQSLVIVTFVAGNDRYYRNGVNRYTAYSGFCNDTGNLYSYVRENGAGYMLKLKDVRREQIFGPWNKDACPK